ncbi:hypothetical protein OIU34_22170 [Pararhizobium sp. BT-229]|uniref:hypothetical protein n=1 Tax=Pararhizobium sp. BT-229 TaxID=2986923 RepID=UPI0021F75100|nr:hypothetical protein [Pararhizobium sp. BT-229]MCV9964600.1 hypothetical protein [Pararhizobium sp. BT-229]
MADASSPALASIFARAKYEAILTGVGPRRDGLLAAEYQSTVFAVVRELAASMDIPLEWKWGPDTDPLFYREMDLSCVRDGWKVLGAAAQMGGFVWVVAAGQKGTAFERWTAVYEFGCRFDKCGYGSEWVATGPGSLFMQFNPDEYGPELLGIQLAKRLAVMSAAHDLAPEE